jgi:DNA-binding LytR/AlgR family response regulator
VKIQKSFIVNRKKVEKIEKGQVIIKGKTIALNRENRAEIIRRLIEM